MTGYFQRVAEEAEDRQQYIEQAAKDLELLEDAIYYKYKFHSAQAVDMEATAEHRMRHMHMMNLLIELASVANFNLPDEK